MDIEQIKKDMDNGVIICKVTLVALVDEALRLKRGVSIDLEVAHKLADDLYQQGFLDARSDKDYDPRASQEWQSVVDVLTFSDEVSL